MNGINILIHIIYRPIMRDLANEIRAIKQEIKKVNGKNL